MKNILKKLREDDGFSLLEMAIVIMIITALLLLIIPNVSKVSDKTDETTSEAVVNTVETQILLYEMDSGEKLEGDALLNALIDGKYITPEQRKAYEEYLRNK